MGNFLDPDKIGEPSVRARFLLGNHRLDLFLFSYFTPAPLPDKMNRFNFFDGAVDISEDPLYTSSSKRLRQQFALRWEQTIGSADVGLSYFNGYEKFPVVNLSPGATEADSLHYEMQQLDDDVQMSLGNWLIKAEAVFQDTGIAGSFIRDSVLPNGTVVLRDLVPEDHAAFMGGFDYTFFGLIGKSDLGILVEYL